MLSWWRGHPAGWWNPLDYNLASICVPIATQVPHAAGLAWGKKLRGERTVALAFFGDGATSEGAFHEGANFAGVMRAPLILLCNNNQWAISTPLSAQTAAPTLADKAIGYGMPGVRVDGGDVLAVYEATRDAVDAGAGGRRPDLHRGRHVPRGAARDRGRPERLHRPGAGRGGEGSESASAGSRATSGGSACSTTRRSSSVKTEALEAMREGIAAAEAEPPADPELVFAYAYADPPPTLREGWLG